MRDICIILKTALKIGGWKCDVIRRNMFVKLYILNRKLYIYIFLQKFYRVKKLTAVYYIYILFALFVFLIQRVD